MEVLGNVKLWKVESFQFAADPELVGKVTDTHS